MLHFRSAWISRFLISLGLLLGLLGLIAGTASAQDRRQNAPGEFDFYVLSLSWSPSFCEEAAERGNEGRSQAQCGGRPFSFVVHGLWPQYEHGFPDYCQRPVAAARSQYHDLDAGPDAGARADLQRVGQARHLLGTWRARLFRDHPQGARGGEDSAGISRIVGAEDRRARRDRGRLHQGQSGPEQFGDRGDLQPHSGSARCGSA